MRREQAAVRALSTAFVVLLTGAVVLLGLASGAAAAPVCLPAGVPQQAVGTPLPRTVGKPSLVAYLDGSLSMAGYADGATDTVRPLGDLIAVVERTAQRAQAPLRWRRFGVGLGELTAAQASGFARGAAYRSGDNQESRIDLVLNAVRDSPRSQISIVVTDLWLSNKAFAGSPQVALGGPLSELLAQGRAIGVLGVEAPYRGKLYDLQGQPLHAGARPLFVLIVGPEADVVALRTALAQSGSPAFTVAATRWALFTTAAANPWRAAPRVSALGAGALASTVARELAPLPQFRFRLSQGGQLVAVTDAARGPAAGSVWSGPLRGTAQAWLLKDIKSLRRDCGRAWEAFGPLAGAWSAVPQQPTQGRFAFTPAVAAGLPPGRAYLVTAALAPTRLLRPNPQTQWMRDWSLAPAEQAAVARRRPTLVKALNLADLAGLMEAAVERSRPATARTAAAFAFVVQIDR